jgi:predicted dehydrogenase
MSNFSRRKFIQSTVAGAAGLAAMPLLQGFSVGANDTVRIGVIGLGQQANNLIGSFSRIPGVQVIAGADVYGIKRQRFEQKVKEYNQSKNIKAEVVTYKDYRAILDRKDIDAVIIA